MSRSRRYILIVLGGLAVVIILGALTLASPVRPWRTGRVAPPLALTVSEAVVEPGDGLWIDTDAACGTGSRVDPDDCLAIAALLRAGRERVRGVSTVFGNAPLSATDATARELVGLFTDANISVFRGASGPASDGPRTSDATLALQESLASGPLTIVALGPLTNIADALEGRADLQANVKRLIAVMGHQPGHIFHPSEGAPGAMLLGHGPVFRDFNFAQDQAAARRIVAMKMPLVLVPYDASRALMVGADDLDALSAGDAVGRWLAERSRGWLNYWQSDIAQSGFYPFDLAAAGYALHATSFSCALVRPVLIQRGWFWSLLLGESELVVEETTESGEHTLYCPSAERRLKDRLIATIAGAEPLGGQDHRRRMLHRLLDRAQ